MDLHRDRARAESFGSVAEQYDRYRPSPPAALVDDLVALRPARVLDVGCGTGKAAVALAARGLSVLGVEPDERMASVARGHGITVEVAPFETWDAGGRRFDLLAFADSWHWIDPVVGPGKAAALLTPGGAIALFWNGFTVSESVASAFDAVYREHAPEVVQVWRSIPERPSIAGFPSSETRTYEWDRVATVDEWVAVVATISDHQRLGPRLEPLLADLRRVIVRLGGVVPVRHHVHLVLARRG